MVRGFRIFLPLLLTRVISPFSMDSFTSSSVRKAKKRFFLIQSSSNELKNKTFFYPSWQSIKIFFCYFFHISIRTRVPELFLLKFNRSRRAWIWSITGQAGKVKRIRWQFLGCCLSYLSLGYSQSCSQLCPIGQPQILGTLKPSLQMLNLERRVHGSRSPHLLAFAVDPRELTVHDTFLQSIFCKKS